MQPKTKKKVLRTHVQYSYSDSEVLWTKTKKKRYSEHKYNILILKCCEQKQKKVHSKQIRID